MRTVSSGEEVVRRARVRHAVLRRPGGEAIDVDTLSNRHEHVAMKRHAPTRTTLALIEQDRAHDARAAADDAIESAREARAVDERVRLRDEVEDVASARVAQRAMLDRREVSADC